MGQSFVQAIQDDALDNRVRFLTARDMKLAIRTFDGKEVYFGLGASNCPTHRTRVSHTNDTNGNLAKKVRHPLSIQKSRLNETARLLLFNNGSFPTQLDDFNESAQHHITNGLR
uniref:AlNc14C448G11714 protein n=1 Tax=Albugo laibachii Nc14 TaxID=890382 RepID=F0WZX2_9STRA|nr:AlNc14C448G11714 [Albugo laibachii Nc14]|eukprot:CCA27052.1 AlNc14C448G11714 [Albugo laibachii Nc14]